MRIIGREAPREMVVKTRTSAMETQEAARERRLEARKEREERRAEAQRIAEEASIRREVREAGTLVERVERARARIAEAPVGSVIAIIEALSDYEREAFLLAEETGPRGAQSPILTMFPGILPETRAEYERLTEEDPDMAGRKRQLDDAFRESESKRIVAERAEAEAAGDLRGENGRADDAGDTGADISEEDAARIAAAAVTTPAGEPFEISDPVSEESGTAPASAKPDKKSASKKSASKKKR